jgi:hypothetical protein
MITIPEAVESIIRKSPFLTESLSQGIINISALARKIKPQVQDEVMKEIQIGAVVMALNRLSKRIQVKTTEGKKLFGSAPDLMVRSNLIEITFVNSDFFLQKQRLFLEKLEDPQNCFLTFTQGIFETTIIAGKELKPEILAVFKDERIISQFDDLSAITVLLPPGTALMPGAYDFILKSLAWESINIVEVVSTFNEFTMILKSVDSDKAFSVIKRLF